MSQNNIKNKLKIMNLLINLIININKMKIMNLIIQKTINI